MPTYKFQRIPKDSKNTPKDSKKFEKVAKDSKDFKNSKDLISKELKEPTRSQKS